MIKLRSVLDRYEASELSHFEAAELLDMGERTFRRWRRRFEGEGEAGLVDRRLGKPSGKQVPVDEAMQVEELYRTRSCGFTAKHFHEDLVRDYAITGTSGSYRQALMTATLALSGTMRRGTPPMAARARVWAPIQSPSVCVQVAST